MNWQEFLMQKSTGEQKAAVVSKQPLTVVSAGAGAGKTQTLAQRFAYLLASDESCEAQQILVLTFTEKAAQEMRGRIEGQLRALYAEYPDELPFLKDRIEALEDADIATIHSFAMKITREAGLSLDIDPAFSLASAPFEDLFWEEFARALDELSLNKIKQLAGDGELWKKRAEELFGSAVFQNMLNEYTPDALAEACRKAVSVYGSMDKDTDGNKIDREWLWNFTNEQEIKKLQKEKDYPNKIRETWRYAIESDEFAALKTNPKRLNQDTADLKKFIDEPADVFIAQLQASLRSLQGIHPKEFDTFYQSVFETSASDYKKWLTKKLYLASEPSDGEKELLLLLNKAAALAWHCWEQRKNSANCLAMDDLIGRAKEVLENDPSCGEKYRHIMIDEFQDTDPLQNALIEKLWKGENAENPNTLFIVGDLKQSIYRFRHADLTLFKDYIDKAKKSNCGQYINLDKNFRSTKALIGLFNDAFSDIWKNGMGNVSVPYEALEYPDGKEDGFEENALDVLTFTEVKDENGAKPKIEEERFTLYKALAQRLRDICGSVTIYDKELKTRRKCRWSDFTVLVPQRTAYAAIEKAFEYAGIPYALCTSRDYYGRDEIKILINLLNLLSAPDDALALASWLASPFCGLEAGKTEALVSEAAQKGLKKNPAILGELVKEKYPRVIAELDRLRRIAKLRGASAVLMELQKNREYLKAFEPRQRRRASANLAGLIDATREFDASIGSSFAACAEYLQKAAAEKQQKEEPDVIDSSQNCVRVMTIHASKGLQFPITVLAETQKKTASHGGKIKISPLLGLLVSEAPEFAASDGNKVPFVTAAWNKEIDDKASQAEDERCWYVAMTRAQEKLVLCGILKENDEKKTQKQGSFLERFLKIENIVRNETDVRQFDAGKFDISQETTETETEEITKPLKAEFNASPMLSRITASAYALLEWCPAAYRRSFRQGIKTDWENKDNGETGVSGQMFGNIVHCLVRNWDFKESSIAELLGSRFELRMPEEMRDEFAKPETKAEIEKMLSRFAKTETGTMLAGLAEKEGTLTREASFRVRCGELLLVGAADLYWEDGNTLHLIDWKTGGESSVTNAYYLPQLKFYAAALWLAVKDATQRPEKIGVRLVHLRSHESGEIFFTPSELDEIAESVKKAAQRAVSGAFPPCTDRCGNCPLKSGCPFALYPGN
ncbi:MAG: UvrD-helicase domain-containing protein [Synergistaceae bacterium]|nr:UvrD-helicase domain-containing protein [Candidatus Equadaptatus faecalis]